MDKIKRGVEVIKGGGVIAYPTETVYGLGADVFSQKAIKRVYEMKNRPFSEPISIAVCSYEMMGEIAYIDRDQFEFIEHFLPGPVTVLLKKRNLPDILTSGSDLVGIRYPDHKIARKIIESSGPITSTSANVSGRRPPTCIQEIEIKIDFIVDGGRCEVGLPSTIVDLVNMRVMREGALYEEVSSGLNPYRNR
jgi:L-threonylcarbamoyladenylate synthase